MSPLQSALLIAAAMGIACAVLSVFVVLRHWAFIGEGIAHAGFGGAGVAWVLSLLLPGAAFLKTEVGVYVIAIAFCLLVALAIAFVTRRQQVHADTAIGIFLVASLAWGFIAAGLYSRATGQPLPPGWEEYLIGRMGYLPPGYALAAAMLCAAVLLVIILLFKQILSYAFDPLLAEVSGVPVSLVHYLLAALLAVVIVLGMRLMGSLLVTALLVLPGATALLITRRLGAVFAASTIVGLIGAVAGPLAHARWTFIPEGPAIVAALVLQFLLAYAARRLLPP